MNRYCNLNGSDKIKDSYQQISQGFDGVQADIDSIPTSSMARQALINGNFDIWQRGASFTNPSNGYWADRWFVNFNSDGGILPNIVHSRQSLVPDDIANSFYFYRINVDGAGSGFGANAEYALRQRIENGVRYLCGAGKKITVSFWARSSIAGKRIGIRPVQRYGTGGTPSSAEAITGTTFNLTSTWKKYTATFSTNTLVGKTFGTNNDDNLDITFSFAWGSSIASFYGASTPETFVGAGNIDIAQVQVNAGDVALPFQPRSFAEELALCQRYYEKSYDYGVIPGSGGSQGIYTNIGSPATATEFGLSVNFKVRKRVIPTVTIYDNIGSPGKLSAWNGTTTTNGITATPNFVTESKFRITSSFASGNYEVFGEYTADAEL